MCFTSLLLFNWLTMMIRQHKVEWEHQSLFIQLLTFCGSGLSGKRLAAMRKQSGAGLPC